MENDAEKLRMLIKGMREVYQRGENAMEYARRQIGGGSDTGLNDIVATLIAYDLQSGTYISLAEKNPEYYDKWAVQIAEIIGPLLKRGSSLLEVGCGEATTMAGLLSHLKQKPDTIFGFDISWSRIHYGKNYLKKKGKEAGLFVGDLFSIPLASDSIDIVYSSHSLEPNGGREAEAIDELLRVSRKWVVLIEPVYELASEEGRLRMEKHGYVRGLKESAETCGAKVVKHSLLEHPPNPLNPSGLLLLEKQDNNIEKQSNIWLCPVTGTPLLDEGDVFISEDAGLVYPVIRGIPMLRPEHAIVASALKRNEEIP